MKYDALQGAEKYTKAHRRKKRWYRVVTSLACVVVFCTVYALILPAITLENTGCEIPEHTHTQECYTQVTSVLHTKPVCTIEGLNIHQHDNTCYDSEGNLICRCADYVVHRHDSSCFDEDGNLWCPLPEIAVHQHTDSCYTQPEVHEHTSECYTLEQRELTCVEHVHTEDCYVQIQHLACGREESEGHQHDETCMVERSEIQCGLEESEGHHHSESCVDENGEIQCGIEESQGHRHTESCMGTILEAQCGTAESEGHHHDDSCYETTQELVCEIESDHQHIDTCYAWEQVLICDISTEPDELADPVLSCEKREITLHEHSAGCFREDGYLICEMTEVLEHRHTDTCFGTVEESADTESLTCTLPEDENHTHTALCHGTWELTCGMEEHTHTSACFSDAAADVETAQEWEQTFADVRLTGEWPVDVIAIAKTQLGYTESIQNYIVTEDGEVKGITRYGQWYGDPYGDWSGMFASFCLNYAQIPASAVPRGEYCQDWISALSDCGLYRAAGSCSPLRGDIVFLDQDYDGCAEHAGFVSAVSDTGTLTVIEGDYNDAVAQISFRADAAVIIGYGLLAEHTDELSADTDAVAADDSIIPMAENSGNSAEPIDVSNYITGATLFYREAAGEEWITVTDGVVIPGDAKLKLTANFANVPLSDLLANGGVLQFELPQLLLDPAKDGDMTDENGEIIGTVSVENGILTIYFDDEWLQVQNANNVTVISGSFNVSSRVDPAALDDESKGKLVLGDVTIIAQFEEDIAAKNGTVALTKSVSPKIVESEDGTMRSTH